MIPPSNTTQAEMEKIPIRVCPFCGGEPMVKAYGVDNAHCLDGPLFVWNVEIRCDCCASIRSCLGVQEAVDAWNGSSAPFMDETWDVIAMDAEFDALPEAGPYQEKWL